MGKRDKRPVYFDSSPRYPAKYSLRVITYPQGDSANFWSILILRSYAWWTMKAPQAANFIEAPVVRPHIQSKGQLTSRNRGRAPPRFRCWAQNLRSNRPLRPKAAKDHIKTDIMVFTNQTRPAIPNYPWPASECPSAGDQYQTHLAQWGILPIKRLCGQVFNFVPVRLPFQRGNLHMIFTKHQNSPRW